MYVYVKVKQIPMCLLPVDPTMLGQAIGLKSAISLALNVQLDPKLLDLSRELRPFSQIISLPWLPLDALKLDKSDRKSSSSRTHADHEKDEEESGESELSEDEKTQVLSQRIPKDQTLKPLNIIQQHPKRTRV